MKINLVVTCPERDEEITKRIENLDGTPTVHIMCFEQETWHSSSCEKTYLTSDIEIISEDEV
jgi:hypothetical protein